MLDTIFATKIGMSQAWQKNGKRIPVTRCKVEDNIVLSQRQTKAKKKGYESWLQFPCYVYEIGYGNKKFKNMSKPLREKIKKSGFSFGVKQIKGMKVFYNEDNQEEVNKTVKIGDILNPFEYFKVGDVVKVQGKSKGRGFTGVMKRHGFKCGPRTHGQRDRDRAPGSIGASTYPGRVWKGKKMPGHMGCEVKTVTGLVVVHVDPDNKEIWVSGPIPGHKFATVRIKKEGTQKEVKLDYKASGIESQKKDQKQTNKKSQDKEEKKEKSKKKTAQKKKKSKKESKKSDKKSPKKESKKDSSNKKK